MLCIRAHCVTDTHLDMHAEHHVFNHYTCLSMMWLDGCGPFPSPSLIPADPGLIRAPADIMPHMHADTKNKLLFQICPCELRSCASGPSDDVASHKTQTRIHLRRALRFREHVRWI